MKKVNRTFRVARVIHKRTPMHVKVGGAVVALLTAPALLSISFRVFQLGEHVNMYF